ncbi:hypothetical protein [Burkholderia sp. AW49-1]
MVAIGHRSDDGWEIDYSVLEKAPPQQTPTQSAPDEDSMEMLSTHPAKPSRWDDDFREPALEVECDSVKIHHVNSVEVNTTPYLVHRHRFEMREPKFQPLHDARSLRISYLTRVSMTGVISETTVRSKRR